jgi:[protein-PII] uridylyltransferase
MTSETKSFSFPARLQSIAALHRNGATGIEVSLALTRTLDRLLVSVFEMSRLQSQKGIALVALGGYGRKELNFASDIDIMVLAGDEETKTASVVGVNDFLHRLLDHGVDVGHSVRTVGECLDIAGQEFEVWVSLLEARLLAGDAGTFQRFVASVKRYNREYRQLFLERLFRLVRERHQKYGHSAKLLEPNVKNSAGGLRDLHSAVWILLGTSSYPLHSVPPRQTLTTALLGSEGTGRPVHTGLIRDAVKGFDFLLRVRNEMHLLRRNLHDTLEFSFQRQVAEALRYSTGESTTSVERFMRDYYIAARAIAQFSRRIITWAEEAFIRRPHARRSRVVSANFAIGSGKLVLRKSRQRLTNDLILQASLVAHKHGVTFSHKLEETIERRLKHIRPLRSEKETAHFKHLLSSPSGVAATLQHLNDIGVLARWIPEWRPLVAFFQHNVYHYYTADEHTLLVVAQAEQLAAAQNSFGEVFRSLPRRDTLYLACLLHDIAKPGRIGDHEIAGVAIARTILRRLRFNDVVDDVLFLVRNHLLMEQVAFRRNLNDPKTIIDFASHFASPVRLDYLYILTYADLSAVNKNVWTDWKEMLLTDLYRKTREVLAHHLTEEHLRARVQKQYHESIEALASSLAEDIPPSEAIHHLEQIGGEEYLAAFSKSEIAEHVRIIRRQALVATVFKSNRDHTVVTIISKDAPFALSRFCGVLAANDANIFDANIFTRADGVIIDRFRVSDFLSKSALTPEQCQKIQQELLDVFRGAIGIEEVLHRHKMKWKRRRVALNPNVRVGVEFEEHPRYCIIDVYAPDTLGFLYRITKTMSELGLNISFAKIATRVDGIVDSFYVLDRDGTRILSDDRRAHIRRSLLACIKEITSSELTVSG